MLDAKSNEAPSVAGRNVFLDTVRGIVNQDRNSTYGTAENNFQVIGDLWAVYLQSKGYDVLIQPLDVALMMDLLKTARLANNITHYDSWLDKAGYAACGGGILAEQELRQEEFKNNLASALQYASNQAAGIREKEEATRSKGISLEEVSAKVYETAAKDIQAENVKPTEYNDNNKVPYITIVAYSLEEGGKWYSMEQVTMPTQNVHGLCKHRGYFAVLVSNGLKYDTRLNSWRL